MLRGFAVIVLAAVGVSSMEMETVERMVMVRTTGSDLQPAATGYIYKKKNDGQESVFEMGESEVMKQLSKYYEDPQPYNAPIPIKKSHLAKEEDETNAESKSNERIIPVKEKQEEHDKPVDGIADENDDYKKYFDDYTGHYKDDSFEDYLRKIGHFDDGIFTGYKLGKDTANNRYKIYTNKHEKSYGGAGSYNENKSQSYTYGPKENDEADKNQKEKKSDGDEHEQNDDNSKEDAGGHHKDNEHKNHGYYGADDKQGYHKYAYGPGAHERDGSHDHHNDHNGAASDESADHSAESDSKHGYFGFNSRPAAGKSYGFEVKH